jgi:hypothetical protein
MKDKSHIKDSSHILVTCAFCPNPCRKEIPLDSVQPRESQTPSAISLLAHFVAQKEVALNEEVYAALTDLEFVEICQRKCVYEFNIVSAVTLVIDEIGSTVLTKKADR